MILSALDGRGFPVASVTTARPSLDDVYLHYTGRDLAAEDEEHKPVAKAWGR
jgi:ABC-2 type transport system ATP-binding protein